MKKKRLTFTGIDEKYICKYLLETNDEVDTKIFELGLTGRLPQIIPCRMDENNNEREFVYEVEGKLSLAEFMKKEISKKQMLILLYNILSALEKFGTNMISLSYVAKETQYIFVDQDKTDVYFIVAPVDKEISDLNEIRNLIKEIIVGVRYVEADEDNYVARIITFINKSGTFSIGDTKKFVEDMLHEININVENIGKEAEKNNTSAGKVSRVAVMQNNARMNQPAPMPVNGQPMYGQPAPMPMNGQPMYGQPMYGQPAPMPVNGQPMYGQPAPMPVNGQPMYGQPAPMPVNGQPMYGQPAPMPVNGQPMYGQPAPMPVNGQPMPTEPLKEQQAAPVPYLLRVKNDEKIYINKPEFTIGKSEANADYSVDENIAVSKIHCIINRQNGVSYIRDNNSENGTFLNGKDIKGEEKVFLTNNAKLVLGNEEFIYFVR